MTPDDQAIPSFWDTAKPSPKLLAKDKDELAQIILRKCHECEELLVSSRYWLDVVGELTEILKDTKDTDFDAAAALADQLEAAHIKATRNQLDKSFKKMS